MGAVLKFLGGLGLGSLNGVLSILTAGMNGALSLAMSAMNAMTQYHQQGIEFARSMGMSLQQAQAYTTVLTNRAAELGFKYGVAADAVKELQQNLAEATGKAAMLNDVDAEKFLQMNKLVGSNVTRQFTSEIMNHLGGQIHTVEGAVSKAYATAAKSGLNAAQFSEKVAKNLSMANKLSFRNGVNGIIKMTALSEKLGFNLQSVEQAANNFMEIDKAIENAAHLQMLGGAAGAYGSNPLTMAYEANYDPEAFTERMTKMLGGYAQFDAKTGMANVNGMNRDFVKNIAQAMGISMDEAMSIAKKQAEIKYKESSGLAAKVRALNLSDEQKDYLINASYIGSDGQLKMTDENGKERDVSGFTQNELNKMMSLQNMSDEDIMKQQALTLTSVNEKLAGTETSIIATLANGVNGSIEKINALIKEFGPEILKEAQELAPKIGEGIDGVLDFIHNNGDKITEGIHKIGNFLGFIYDHWEIFLGAFLGIKFLGWFTNFSNILTTGFQILGKGAKATTRTASAAAKGGTSAVSKAAAKGAAKTSGSGAAKTAVKTGSKAVSKVAGAALASVTSLGFSGVELNDVKRQMEELDESFKAGKISQDEYTKELKELRNQKNETLGAGAGGAALGAIGTLFDEFGPWGTIIGAIIGEYIGRWIGKIWNSITNPISEFWNVTLRDAVDKLCGRAGTAFVDSIGSLVDGITNGYGVILENIVSGFGDMFDGIWEGIKTSFGGTWDGLIKIIHGDFSGFLDIVASQAEGTMKTISGVAVGLWKTFQAPFLGGWELLKGLWTSLSNYWEGVYILSNRFFGSSFEVGRMIRTAASRALSNIGQIAKGVINDVVETVKGTFSDIKELVKDTWGDITNTVGEYFEHAVGEFYDAKQYIKDTWNEYVVAPWNSITTSFKNGLDSVLGFFRDVRDGAKAIWNKISNFSLGDAAEAAGEGAGWLINKVANFFTGHANGGIVGGNSFSGDKVLTRVNSGEMILNASQQSGLFSFISNMPSMLSSFLTNSNDVKAKPVGEREYIYTPSKNNNGNGVTEVTVRDINLNINGTLKLDAGTITKNLDINQLLSDTTFISSLKDLIKQSINNDINNGRFMNDIASMRGMPSQVGLWGRK